MVDLDDDPDASSASALTYGLDSSLGGNLAKGLRKRRKAPGEGPEGAAAAAGGRPTAEELPSTLGADDVLVGDQRLIVICFLGEI